MADFFNEIDAMPTPVSERKKIEEASDADAIDLDLVLSPLSPEGPSLKLPELSEPAAQLPFAAETKPRATSNPKPRPKATPKPKPKATPTPRPRSTPRPRPTPSSTTRTATTPSNFTVRSTASSRARERQISPQTSTGRATTPSRRNLGPAPVGHDGLTMWERTQLHMEQRERKLVELRERLYEECTFSPNTTSTSSYKKNSVSSSISSGTPDKKPKSTGIVGTNISVFDRLYALEAKRAATPTRTPGSRPNSRGRARHEDTPGSRSTLSARVEALYSLGRQKVETRKNLTEKVRKSNTDLSFFNPAISLEQQVSTSYSLC